MIQTVDKPYCVLDMVVVLRYVVCHIFLIYSYVTNKGLVVVTSFILWPGTSFQW